MTTGSVLFLVLNTAFDHGAREQHPSYNKGWSINTRTIAQVGTVVNNSGNAHEVTANAQEGVDWASWATARMNYQPAR